MSMNTLICGLALTALASALCACAQNAGPARSDALPDKPERPRPLMRDFMGINSHTMAFDAPLYAPVCRLVRDNHPLAWDTNYDTAAPLDLPIAREVITWKDSTGKHETFSGLLNWDELYGKWNHEGFEVSANITFGKITFDRWKDPDRDAFTYGRTFAEVFGPSGKAPRVSTIEIDGQPSATRGYTPEQYKQIFTRMAAGVREGDPKMAIATCAIDPADSDAPFELFLDIPHLYDVISVRKFAVVPDATPHTRSYPEDPALGYLDSLRRAIAWRDAHAPDKQVWMTEFGYDAATPRSATQPAASLPGTDLRQAQWIVRSYLVFSAMGFDRAYQWWFNDADAATPWGGSGLTRNYEPKPSYYAVSHLYRTLGDYRFSQAIETNPNGDWVLEFTHGVDPARRVWVAWSATGKDLEKSKALKLPGKLIKAERMSMGPDENNAVQVKSSNGTMEIPLTESPVYLWIE